MYYKQFRKTISNAINKKLDFDIQEFGWNNALETSLRLFEQAHSNDKEIKIVSGVAV